MKCNLGITGINCTLGVYVGEKSYQQWKTGQLSAKTLIRLYNNMK